VTTQAWNGWLYKTFGSHQNLGPVGYGPILPIMSGWLQLQQAHNQCNQV